MEKIIAKVPFIDNVLKGIGQIMLQENSITGLLFLIGIFLGSIQGGIAAFVATAVGTLTAMLLKFDEKNINSGLYGFSAALVGVALLFIFQSTVILWILVVVGSALATIIQNFFINKNIPVFTLPFILITWVLFFVIHQFNIVGNTISTESESILELHDLCTSTNGFGEVIFQGGPMSGIIFFIAVFISSPTAALYGLAASIFGAEISDFFGEPIEQIHMGLFGFNAVLTAIVFAGPKKIDGLWVFIGLVVTVLIDILLVQSNVLAMVGGVFTFPFVAGTWVTLFLKNKIKF
ncbi:urea transporter [Chishuiella sp.]|uniref:urea transporter n=1 Tax=Chishuiella sp. TaxID=1969467 RepID=UPI0028AE5833|nr:urea transporter [Chishuiella sp.]